MVSKIYRQRVTRAAKLFRLVASPTRALILSTLTSRKTCSVQELASEIDMTHSAVSHQLALLSRAKIVKAAKDGRNTHYSVAPSTEAKALSRFLTTLLG
ncbi:MAG: transcriptional regulatory protein [Candidatus Kaiserbacteria bacterium]|nr:transcriptional regulatory protein [Candidatus Kaiserbacteria bacterium]